MSNELSIFRRFTIMDIQTTILKECLCKEKDVGICETCYDEWKRQYTRSKEIASKLVADVKVSVRSKSAPT
jgi:hypothetical protein